MTDELTPEQKEFVESLKKIASEVKLTPHGEKVLPILKTADNTTMLELTPEIDGEKRRLQFEWSPDISTLVMLYQMELTDEQGIVQPLTTGESLMQNFAHGDGVWLELKQGVEKVGVPLFDKERNLTEAAKKQLNVEFNWMLRHMYLDWVRHGKKL